MIFQTNLNRQILLKYLVEGICQVSFTKVKDNTNRILLCTLEEKTIPSIFHKSIENIFKPVEDEDLLPVWDVAEGKWKSFRISKINSFRTPDELLKNDKSGQDVNSKQAEEIEKRKRKTSNERYRERIAKLKEQAELSKQNLEK